MARGDDLIATIEAVHAAGLDSERWPHALGAVARLCGGIAATLEVLDKHSFSHREFHRFGIPPAAEIAYLAAHVTNNPRWELLMPRQKSGDIGWDYQFIDEQKMDREPLYAEFLACFDMRYFLSGVLLASHAEYACVSVQRTQKQGHAQRRDIELMTRLVPHLRQALETSRRLRAATDARQSLERAIDWLAEGVALIGADGRVIHANESFAAIARRGDGLAVHRGKIDMADPIARGRLADALAAVLRLRNSDSGPSAAADVPIPRHHGAPPYLLSVRPLVGRDRPTAAVAIVSVHDPSQRNAAAIQTLREIFGLTEAEASIAQALHAGTTLPAYAKAHGLSLNTVYTHLRRTREKTGCNRMAELIRKLNDLHVPLRQG